MQQAIEKAAVLIEALPYIQAFRGARVVVKLGGSVMESAAAMRRILTDVVFMECVGMRVVLVHGGGKAISRAMSTSGVAPRFVAGLRVTCERTIKVVESVLKQEVNPQLVEILGKCGARAEALHGDGIFLVERKSGSPAQADGLADWGYVGEPVAVDIGPVASMTSRAIIPVVTPLGRGRDGKLYNMNADIAAAALARELRARKLAFVSDVPGLLRDRQNDASLIGSVRLAQVPALKEQGVLDGGMLPKIDSCVDAIRAGVGKVHLVDGRMPHSLLLEIFTNTGVGTEIIADE